MADKQRLSYRGAGVDIEAGDRAVDLIKKHAASTMRPEVIGGLGGFAGAFRASFDGVSNPVLLSATDGVGTKLAFAQQLDKHDTVGIDLVAMVVDDLVCNGAEPLFFLDYIACGRLIPERIEQIVAGIAEGCRQAGCSLVGGETAEHPGLMDLDEYDLAGFGVGVAGAEAIWGPDRVRAGDTLIGLASSGLHSNGYSLVRAIVLQHDLDLAETPPGWGKTLGEELLEPTRIYARDMLALGDTVHAAAHITGGGIEGNVARILPGGLEARLKAGSWPEPAVFSFLRSQGNVSDDDMKRTFNLGLGMVLAVARPDAAAAIERLAGFGCPAYEVGEVMEGNRGAVIT